jgi:hypothetical protein
MSLVAPNPQTPRIAAPALFFFLYLAFHTIYPTLSWFLPGYELFAWQMYSGYDSAPRFTAVFADGSRREIGNPQKTGAALRILGTSVDQQRFVPPWLCTHWAAESVSVVDQITRHEERVPCPSTAR